MNLSKEKTFLDLRTMQEMLLEDRLQAEYRAVSSGLKEAEVSVKFDLWHVIMLVDLGLTLLIVGTGMITSTCNYVSRFGFDTAYCRYWYDYQHMLLC